MADEPPTPGAANVVDKVAAERSPQDEKEFDRLTELFKFYLQLVLNTFIFALGISGGVCAFALGKDNPHRVAAVGLLLPAALCIGLGFAFRHAMDSTCELDEALQTLKSSLKLKLAPHAKNLTAGLGLFGLLLIICGIGLIALSVCEILFPDLA
jgi:hypothetical protein